MNLESRPWCVLLRKSNKIPVVLCPGVKLPRLAVDLVIDFANRTAATGNLVTSVVLANI